MRAPGFILLPLAALLVACAPAPPKVSMADRDPLRRAVVADVVLGLSEVFDPASTPLVLVRQRGGAFDTALFAAMRARGFPMQVAPGRGQDIDCRVDPVEGTMYRVTARVGKTTLSRLWVLDGARAYAGGAWARRE
jgi:hypothetical protein